MVKKHPIVLPLAGTSDGSSNFDLISKRWKSGFLFAFQRCAFRVSDHNPTQFDVGIRRGGTNFWLYTDTTTNKDDIGSVKPNVWCPTDYQIIIRFVGTTSGDLCEAWIYGYIEEG